MGKDSLFLSIDVINVREKIKNAKNVFFIQKLTKKTIGNVIKTLPS